MLTLLAGFPVVLEFIQRGFIAHIPLAILSVGLGLISIITLALGLILDAITHQHNIDFEHKLINYK